MNRMKRISVAVLLAAGTAAGVLAAGCSSSKDAKQGVVATVNGDEIKTTELREILGVPGGVFAVTDIPMERKKEALDQLVSWRLLTQDARTRGLDNTQEYSDILRQNAQMVMIKALLRKEIAAKLKVTDKEIQAEIAKVKEANKGIPDAAAAMQAVKTVFEGPTRKIQEELIATAKKDTGATIDQPAVNRIGKGEKVPDNAVLASAGEEKISYGDVKKVLQGLPMPGGPHGQPDLSKNPVVIANVLNRELTLRALNAYARKQGIEGTDIYKATRKEMEWFVLRNLDAEKIVSKDLPVTDKEIEAAYAEHAQQLIRNGKKIPLAQVKEQLRGYLQGEKGKKALDTYVAELKKKAKITVDEVALSKA